VVCTRRAAVDGLAAFSKAAARFLAPATLAAAFVALQKLRKQIRDRNPSFGTDDRLRAEVSRDRSRKLNDAERAAYGRYVARLASARQIEVPGVAKGRAVEVWLPDW